MSAKETTYDKRTALPDGFELTINEKNTDNKSENTYKITIQRKIASGGSCLVYRGVLDKCVGDEKATYDVIVKEVYPKRLDEEITRSDEYKLKFTSEGGKCEYERFLSHFCKGQVKHVVYATNNSENALPPLFCSGISEETGAFYAVSRVTSGQVLSEMDLKDYSIVEALELSISLCEAIGKVHEGGRNNDCQYSLGLFLDCKPDNIFVLNNRAYLFDFDTVQPKGDFSFCSYSEGWSAPEQKINNDIGYSDVRKIGYHTDIFSIGSVLFYMLTGENPYEAGLDAIHEGFDWKDKIKLKDTTGALEDEEFVKKLDQLMSNVLEKDPAKRKKIFNDIDATATLTDRLNAIKDKASCVTFIKETTDIKNEINDVERAINTSLLESREISAAQQKTHKIIEGISERVIHIETQIDSINENSSNMNESKGENKKKGLIRNIKAVLFDTYYEGETWNGKRDGYGTLFKKDRKLAEGMWKNGKLNGEGSIYRGDGSLMYHGAFKNNKLEGKGTFYSSEGWRYEGEFSDDRLEGSGVFYFEDGYRFEGMWKNDTRNGAGIYYYSNGNVDFEGVWIDGRLTGKVTKHREDGSVIYIGEYLEGKPNGHGTEYDEDRKRIYEGEWRDGDRDGHGVFYYEDGYRYEGEWKNDSPNGYGIVYDSNGNINIEGVWKDGKLNGKGTLYYENGFVAYEGGFVDFFPSGTGIAYREDGSVEYEGEYMHGRPHGIGTLYFEDGGRYDGEWKNGMRDGHGLEFRGDGTIEYDGMWKNNQRHGAGTLYNQNQNFVLRGEFRNGLANGMLTCIQNGVVRCEMPCRDGLANGLVKEYYDDGLVKSEIEMTNGKRNGFGTEYREDGSIIYEGEYRNNKRHGKGALYYPDGSIEYDGDWKNDKQVDIGEDT